MIKHKPRGPVPSLIGGSNGRPRIVKVKRKCNCHRCKVEIMSGSDCICIPKIGGAYNSPKRYCKDCYKDILTKSVSDLNDVKDLL